VDDRGRFLIISWDGGGNVPPAVALGRRLVGHGHQVSVLGPRSLQQRFEQAGCAFRPYTSVPEWDPSRGRALEDQPEVFLDLLCGERLANDVLGEVSGHPPQVAIVDCMLGGALCALERAEITTAALVHFLYQPWADIWGASMLPVVPTRQMLGLPALENDSPTGLLHNTAAVLILTAADLDFPVQLPAHASYVGPIFDDDPANHGWQSPWPCDDERPLVVVSLSTTYQHQEAALARVLHALGELPVRVLVTLGHTVQASEVTAPPNATLLDWVPHRSVLGHASLVVTHAGHGTILVALAHGVPLLCLPLGREQFFNADRVQAIGAGEVVSAEANDAELHNAAKTVLTTTRYRAAAATMAATIARYGNGTQAIEAIEGLLQQPVRQ
jgi:UDP:flavonoid glycosyltransferase YjiC (YdhE family)